MRVDDDYWRNVELEEQRKTLDDYQERVVPTIRTLRGKHKDTNTNTNTITYTKPHTHSFAHISI